MITVEALVEGWEGWEMKKRLQLRTESWSVINDITAHKLHGLL